MTINEAASKLNLTPYRVRYLCRENQLPAAKTSKGWIVHESALRLRAPQPNRALQQLSKLK